MESDQFTVWIKRIRVDDFIVGVVAFNKKAVSPKLFKTQVHDANYPGSPNPLLGMRLQTGNIVVCTPTDYTTVYIEFTVSVLED